jgi:hypothetical protein
MNAHTPGPWLFNQADDTIRAFDGALLVQLGVRSGTRKDTLPIRKTRAACLVEGHANAALIAAAPELLAALDTVLQAIYDGRQLTPFSPEYRDALNALYAARGQA